MGNKTIYVRDEKLWNQAKTLAGKEGMSALVHEALTAFVRKKQLEDAGFEHVRIEPTLLSNLKEPVQFMGKLLVAEHWTDPHAPDDVPQPEYDLRVYRTPAGNLVLTIHEGAGCRVLLRYQNLSEFPTVADLQSLLEQFPEPEEISAWRILEQTQRALGADWVTTIP